WTTLLVSTVAVVRGRSGRLFGGASGEDTGVSTITGSGRVGSAGAFPGTPCGDGTGMTCSCGIGGRGTAGTRTGVGTSTPVTVCGTSRRRPGRDFGEAGTLSACGMSHRDGAIAWDRIAAIRSLSRDAVIRDAIS